MFAGLALVLITLRVKILTGLADIWVVNDSATKADAIVILGGGVENRPVAAAKLFQEGCAPKILFMDVRLGPGAKMGILLPEQEMTRRILLSNNVPETAFEKLGSGVTSTYDESRAVRAWVEKTGAKSIIIPTDLFHTRRARWVFRHELHSDGVKVYVCPVVPVEGYGTGNWWHYEQGLISFENEVVKLVYYWCKY